MTKYLVFSDIHENLSALERLLQLPAVQECEEFWFLGDVLGHNHDHEVSEQYFRCLEILVSLLWDPEHPEESRRAGKKLTANLQGNWELWLEREHGDEDDRYKDGQGTQKTLLQSARRELKKRPNLAPYWASLARKQEKGDFTLVHGSPIPDSKENVEPEETYLVRSRRMGLVERIFLDRQIRTRHLIFGHTHQPGYFQWYGEGITWIGLQEKQLNVVYPIPNSTRLALNPGSLDTRYFHHPTALILDISADQSPTYQFIACG